MKKKWFSYVSVMLLVSPSLIGAGHVFADSIEPEQTNEVKGLDNKESINEKESVETAESPEQDAASDNTSSEIDVKETVESSSIQGHTKETLDSEEHMNEAKNFNQAEKIDDDLATEINGTSASVMQTDDIDSGTLGTCEWRIDSEGTLNIESGTLPDNPGFAPWYDVDNKVIKKIKFEGEVVAGKSIAYLFAYLVAVTQIENLHFLNTSATTDMQGTFQHMQSLTELDVSSLDTSKVTEMLSIFYGSYSLTSLDISDWDMSNVNMVRTVDFFPTSVTRVVLGEKTKMSINLPVPSSSDEYLGTYWIKTGTKNMYSYRSFGIKYNDDPVTMAGEYFWAKRPIIETKESTIYKGDSWEKKDNFVSGTDEAGDEISVENLTVSGTVNVNVPGVYNLRYVYNIPNINSFSVDTKVTVKDIQTAVNVHDSTIY
ncbi:bacterial Ig-like domain-containing protein, partial [Enterococcus faecalis]|nr:bacterial Ig-like domain-containing protein [Enterococcus faecalis]